MEQIRNKEQTKRKLIDAVGYIFKTEGYAGLGLNKTAKIAGVHKKLIYRYFGSYERLVEAYVTETDYWMKFAETLRELEVPGGQEETKRFITTILQNQFNYFYAQPEMQQLILWEMSSDSELMRSIHRTREMMGQELLQLTDPYLKSKPVNFRAVAALLVGGIYYTILHSRTNGGQFTGIDINSEEGRSSILKTIEQIVSLIFV